MPKRRAIWFLVGLVLLYPTSYLLVSRKGFYVHDPRASAKYSRSLPDDDNPYTHKPRILVHCWRPFAHYTRSTPGIAKTWEALYSPLVRLDRAYWHRDSVREIPVVHYPLLSTFPDLLPPSRRAGVA
ncbi:hypothetical protein [Haloferula sp.]|uniref:hypothetical protein n=1 Tax=Haloferula sp. TaxID=2497595 RepID=UPI0032A06C0D